MKLIWYCFKDLIPTPLAAK